MFPCTSAFNIQCKLCSTCNYGNYISSACNATSDTVCSRCTSCGEMEYEETECTAGVDAKCQSCQQCSFADKSIERQCTRSNQYEPWRRANCCKSSTGELVSCDSVDLADIKIVLQKSHAQFVTDEEL